MAIPTASKMICRKYEGLNSKFPTVVVVNFEISGDFGRLPTFRLNCSVCVWVVSLRVNIPYLFETLVCIKLATIYTYNIHIYITISI